MHAVPAQLSAHHRELLSTWLPEADVVRDHSWGLVGTTVLELRGRDGATYAAKAGNAADHHLAREINAHRRCLRPWTALGRGRSLSPRTRRRSCSSPAGCRGA